MDRCFSRAQRLPVRAGVGFGKYCGICWISHASQEVCLLRGYRKDMCHYLSTVCVCVLMCVRHSEEVRLYTAHLSTSGRTDCVWLFNNWVRSTPKTHTLWVQPEDRAAVTPPPTHTHKHTYIHPLLKPLMAPEGPQFPILPLPISGLHLLYFLCNTHSSLSVSLSSLSSKSHTNRHTLSHTHTCSQRHINTLCVNVIFPRLHPPLGGTEGDVFSFSEQTAV